MWNEYGRFVFVQCIVIDSVEYISFGNDKETGLDSGLQAWYPIDALNTIGLDLNCGSCFHPDGEACKYNALIG